MRSSTVHAVALVAAIASLWMLAAQSPSAHAQKVCPHCTCPAKYEPLCAFDTKSGRYRGFQSRCVMDCMNECRNNIFEFRFLGRCGKNKIQLRPTTTPSDE